MKMMRSRKNLLAAGLIVIVTVTGLVFGFNATTTEGAQVGRTGPTTSPSPGGQPGRGGARQLSVVTQTVKLSDVGGGQVFTGSVTPAFTTNLSSRVSGRVATINVKVGERVTIGDTLATLDTAPLKQTLEQSQSNAAVSQANYTKASNDQANSLANAEKARAVQQAAYERTISDQQNAVAAAKQAVVLSQAQLNNAITGQQNSIASAKQGLTTAQTSFNSTQASASMAVTVAQNNLNAQLDALLTSQNNSLDNAKLTVQQAISALNIAQQAGNQLSVDSATSKLQSAQLAMQQVQQAQFKDAQSAQQSAQAQLTNLQNALMQTQSSQAVQVAQEALNTSLTNLANAQATAAAQIEISEVQLNQQQLTFNNAISTQQAALNSAKSTLEQAEQTFKTAQSTDSIQVSAAQYKQAQTNVKVLQEQLQDSVLTSPVTGVVSAILIPIGQNAGQAAILSVASMDPTLVRINVSEASIGKIKLNSAMTVQIPTLAKTYEGQVYTIYPTMDSATKSYMVDIKIDDPLREITPGMFAKASMKSGGRQSLMIPADAVQSQASGNAVYIVKEGKAKKVLIKIGEITSSHFEVTDGLNVGEELVIQGQELLSDGVQVQVGQPGQQPGQGRQGQGTPGQSPPGQGTPGQSPQGQGGQRQGTQGQGTPGQGGAAETQSGSGQANPGRTGTDAGATRAGGGQ